MVPGTRNQSPRAMKLIWNLRSAPEIRASKPEFVGGSTRGGHVPTTAKFDPSGRGTSLSTTAISKCTRVDSAESFVSSNLEQLAP